MIAAPGSPRRAPQLGPGAVRKRTSPQRVLPFRMGLPALDAFPRKLWSRLAAREIRRITGPTIWPIRIPRVTVHCGR